MDVCWRDDSVLASCSSDHSLAVYSVNDSKPLHRLKVVDDTMLCYSV